MTPFLSFSTFSTPLIFIEDSAMLFSPEELSQVEDLNNIASYK